MTPSPSTPGRRISPSSWDVSPAEMSRLGLRFQRSDLEAEFWHDYFQRFLPQIRVALLLAFVLYALFGVLDPFVSPGAEHFAWLVRYAVVCPLILLTFALSWTSHFERWVHQAWVALGVMATLGIIGIMLKSASFGTHPYYAGLMLVCTYLYTFVRLRCVLASLTCWSIVVLYDVVALSTPGTPAPVLFTNTFFLICVNIVGMAASYWMERGVRVDFLQQRFIRRQTDELRAALGELQTKNAELDSFVYSVSHDLKAPLVTIQGMAGLLLEDYGARLDAEGRHYLERLDVNTRHMERLLLDLLTLSRVGREGRPAELVDASRVVEDLLDRFAEVIRDRGISVIVHPLPTLWAIPVHVEQVFANLVGNAFKYLGDRVPATIEIGALDRGALVECYVRDSGIGIDPAYHTTVFEVFQRLKDVETDGTGVGLAIVKKIVEGNGGRISVESAKNAGATFRFSWPKRPSELDQTAPEPERLAV